MATSESTSFYSLSAHNIKSLFAHFFDLNNPMVCQSISKLTGLRDEREIQRIAVKVWVDCWIHRNKLLNETRPGVFVYRILVQHVFIYLKARDRQDQILALRKILLIDPIHYIHILEPAANTL